MTPEDFDFAARFMKDQSGLVLTRDKGYLLENRLMPVLRRHSLKTFHDLMDSLRGGDAALQTEAVDAMMAKDTGFFRDWKPFVHFQKVVLPNLRRARAEKKTLRILCAGVSTGQEAYSTAIMLRDAANDFKGWRAEIVGIDISATALAAAVRGVYSQFDVQRGLPIRTLLQNFTRQDENWVLDDGVRNMVKFQTWNLLSDLFPLGRFDVILCRNVLVYVDLQTRMNALQKIARSLTEDGVLYLGIQESITGVSTAFKAVNRDLAIYTPHRADRPMAPSLAIPMR